MDKTTSNQDNSVIFSFINDIFQTQTISEPVKPILEGDELAPSPNPKQNELDVKSDSKVIKAMIHSLPL